MSESVIISASLLSADMAHFVKSMEAVEKAVDFFHCDVMDGHFVPNLTFGAPVIKAIKKYSKLPLDVHLMIENPSRWIKSYITAGLSDSDYLTFHIEAEPLPQKALSEIRSAGIKSGIVIKPGTSTDAVRGLEKYVDQVLIMTVEPGFGGQKFMDRMLNKVIDVRKMFPEEVVIAVDGGIDPDTAPLAFEAGARILVAGNAIFGQADPSLAAAKIRYSTERV